MGGPDPAYVASVAETVRTSIRQSDDPGDFRRHLYELRDTLRESSLEGGLYEELLEQLEGHIDRLYLDTSTHETGLPVDGGERQRILDDLHRIERFCQRRDGGTRGEGSRSDDAALSDGEDGGSDHIEMTGPTVNIDVSGGPEGTTGQPTGESPTTGRPNSGQPNGDTGDSVDARVERAFERLSPCSNWDGPSEVYDEHDPTSDWDCTLGSEPTDGVPKGLPERFAEAGFDVATDFHGEHATYVRRDGEAYIVPYGTDRVLGQGTWRSRVEQIVREFHDGL
jgi:hypothetical protein